MRYVSTRGHETARDFASVILSGTAVGGGLFLPEHWPEPDFARLRGCGYAETVASIFAPFAGRETDELLPICREAYAPFRHPAIVPLVQLDTGFFVAELLHGPTLAFKDLALQLVAGLFDRALAETGQLITVIGATSGDTGAAAIAALRGARHAYIAILHPKGRVSEVQRRQMTTVHDQNVLNIAVEGDFDDCQRIVKTLFADAAFSAELRLAAVNSINWARIAAQIPYYVAAALALGASPERPVAFAVPTGNFGNLFAGYAARRMGLPVAHFVVGSNRNDVLTRFLQFNDLSRRPAEPSLSPSMDISVSSNFERLIFELLDRDGAATATAVTTGNIPEPAWHAARALFTGVSVSDEDTLAAMRRIHAETGYIADPHTAVGIEAARRAGLPPGTPVIALATAHPAKFPDTVARALGRPAPVPDAVAALYSLPERFLTLPADPAPVAAALRAFSQQQRTANA